MLAEESDLCRFRAQENGRGVEKVEEQSIRLLLLLPCFIVVEADMEVEHES